VQFGKHEDHTAEHYQHYPFRLFLLSIIIRWRKCLPVCYPKNVKIAIYRTIILFVLSCEYETWSLRLREERRLRVYEIGYWVNIWD